MKPNIFKLHVPKRHKIVVYIWPTLEAMRERIKNLPGYEPDDVKAYGYFHAPRMRIRYSKPHNVVMRKVVGQIHLAKNEFGAGTFAHELQHFMSWWSVIKDYELVGRDWERVSYLAGNLTTQFWVAYRKRYEE
jgi:hypothetical protein